ncbi:MAG: tetratricopeptide repeat protein [Opitutus sp.]
MSYTIMMLRLLVVAFLTALTLRAETPLETAVALYRTKDYPAAQEAFAKLAETQPQNGEVQFYLGVLAEKRGENETAIQRLEQAVLITPTNSNYMLELGGAYGTAAKKAGLLSKMTWAKKCVTALEKAVELDPENLAARNGLMSYYREAPSFVGGGIGKAYEQAEEIKKRDPIMGAAVLGQLYLSEKKPDEAFAVYEEALKASPDHYGLLYGIGRAAAQTGKNLDRGEQALRRCLELTPGKGDPGPAAIHWRLGNIAESRGDPAAARTAYEAALKADPGFKAATESLSKLAK